MKKNKILDLTVVDLFVIVSLQTNILKAFYIFMMFEED